MFKWIPAIAGTAISVLSFSSCTREELGGVDTGQHSYTLKTEIAGYVSGNSENADDAGLKDIQACIFRGGRLSEIHAPEKTGEAYSLRLTEKTGTMYVLADALDILDAEQFRGQDISEDEWLAAVTGGGEAVRYFTGKVDLDMLSGDTWTIPAVLTRSVARFDLEIYSSADLSVNRITFAGVMQDAYIFPCDPVRTPAGSAAEDFTVDFAEPQKQSIAGIAYFYGQANPDFSVNVSYTVGGVTREKKAALPAVIRRNTVYSVIIRKDVSSADITLEVVEWNNGGSVDLTPDFHMPITVDMEKSSIPDGVSVSSDGRVVILPYTDVDFVLALDSRDELECITDPGDGLSVDLMTEADGVTGTNMFRLRKEWWRLGVGERTVTLQLKRKGLESAYPDDAITLVLTGNPTGISGMMDFNAGYRYDFGRYADNELGSLYLPDGKAVSVEFPEGEYAWIKLDDTGDVSGRVRVIGGWKPNDRTADGRVQSATIVLYDEADGGRREEYTISRRNWGLPVTYLNGIWWCKYNAMGNSKDFGDQILSSEDPAAMAGKTVYEYLESCSPQEYFNLWKWEYQGESGIGLEVKDIDGVAKLDGFRSDISVHMNTLDPHVLAPDGYEVPSFDDFGRIFSSTDGGYIWIMWDGSHRSPWNGGTVIQRRNKRRNDVTVGTLALDDLFYMAMYSNDASGHEPLVWYGAGAQWNDSGVKHAHYNSILFTVYSPEKKGWYFNGGMNAYYIAQNGAGNNDTRILRFKKSDVEYIIQE